MDFDQEKIAIIHDFGMDFEELGRCLKRLNTRFPAGVIIPMLENELSSPVIGKIIDGLNECDYLRKVFIALSAPDVEGYNKALKIFSRFEVPYEVIWCNRREVNDVLEELKEKGLDITTLSGKGRDLWIAIGIASLDLYAFAIHDADIVYYSGKIPTKILYPVIEPRLDFFFSKGYYARVNVESRVMYGRVYRLFINPLLEALQEKLGYRSEFLRYLQAFRYSLSGEVAITSNLALNLRIPCDWGLEIGMLAELFRNASYKRICQVDLGFYEHKHKKITSNELLKTAGDCLFTLLRTLTETDGINVSEDFLLSLQVLYGRLAQDKVRQYHADAICNGLNYDRHQEETNVEKFAKVITNSGKKYLKNPAASQLPDWIRAISAMPDLKERLREVAIE
ncbi:MAG: glucosyl-3-phosphoglycerate synthase [Candidatus Syntropharchaeia archaeon]